MKKRNDDHSYLFETPPGFVRLTGNADEDANAFFKAAEQSFKKRGDATDESDTERLVFDQTLIDKIRKTIAKILKIS
jgi:hypothetical protein